MKKILFVLCLGLVFVGCENIGFSGDNKLEDDIREEIVKRYESGGKELVVTYKGKGNNEEVTKKMYYFEDGIKEKEENYKNVIKDGLWREWYKDGQLKYEEIYKNGKRDSLWRIWYQNGQLYVECNYKDGRIDGLCKCWDEDGNKIECD